MALSCDIADRDASCENTFSCGQTIFLETRKVSVVLFVFFKIVMLFDLFSFSFFVCEITSFDGGEKDKLRGE